MDPVSRTEQLKTFIASLVIDHPLVIHDWQLMDEALTHLSAGLHHNHERLEFLGDAVLRLAATDYIDRNYPELNVGKRSELRAHLVSDRWLAELGEALSIDEVILVGAHARHDIHAQATLRADATEALIGAVFLQDRDLDQVLRWLTPHWQHTSKDVLQHPQHFNSKSALQEWSQARQLGLPRYTTEEVNQHHGDPARFKCNVGLANNIRAEGWGPSRKTAEQNAALAALQQLEAHDSGNSEPH